jgi:hypothetical protein
LGLLHKHQYIHFPNNLPLLFVYLRSSQNSSTVVRRSLSKIMMRLPLEKGGEGKGKEVEREEDEAEDKAEDGGVGRGKVVEDYEDESNWA